MAAEVKNFMDFKMNSVMVSFTFLYKFLITRQKKYYLPTLLYCVLLSEILYRAVFVCRLSLRTFVVFLQPIFERLPHYHYYCPKFVIIQLG